MLRPFCSSPLTAFRLRRISSGSCRGVQELRRRDLLYAVGGMSGSAAKTLKYNIFHIYFFGNFFFSSYKGIRLKLSKSTRLVCTYYLRLEILFQEIKDTAQHSQAHKILSVFDKSRQCACVRTFVCPNQLNKAEKQNLVMNLVVKRCIVHVLCLRIEC